MRVPRPACLTVLLVLGCRSPIGAPDSLVPSQCQALAPTQKTDILFVIDNSGSMRDKQLEIAAELPAFVAQLQHGAGIALDFQVGVITTSVYQNAFLNGTFSYQEYPSQSGHLQPVPGTSERVLSGSDPQLVDKFTQLAQQGTSGSGQETPFEAIRLALSPPLSTTPVDLGGNQGFLRNGARLLIVLVSDEDDCSEMDRPVQVWVNNDTTRDTCHEQAANLTPVSTYFQFLQSLKDGNGQHKEILWASISPVSRSTKEATQVLEQDTSGILVLHSVDCPDAEGTGFRHREMAALFDSSLNDLYSVCYPSYHEFLLAVAAQAGVGQTVEVQGVPDPELLHVEIHRASGQTQTCTVDNGGIVYLPPAGGASGRIQFQGSCLRQADDIDVQVKLLCAG